MAKIEREKDKVRKEGKREKKKEDKKEGKRKVKGGERKRGNSRNISQGA